MRVITVMLSAFAAIALGLWAYAAGSPTLAVSAVLFAMVTILAATGRRRDRTPAKSALGSPTVASAGSPAAPAAQPEVHSVEDGSTGDGTAVAAADVTGAFETAVAETPEGTVPAPGEATEVEPDAPEDDTPGSAAAVEVPDAPGSPAVDADIPPVRTPFSVEPAVVLMSLYDAVAARYDTLAAHLWLLDAHTGTLRLIAAFGPRVPAPEPLLLEDPVLGAAVSAGSAVFLALEEDGPNDADARTWRYAVPVGTPEMRGVAAVDIVSQEEAPSAVVLNEVSAVLRGSLTAALAIQVAHAEMETAVQLLNAAQELTGGIRREALLAAALERAMLVAGASTGSVMMPDPETGSLRIVASKGLPDTVVDQTAVPQGEGIAGMVYTSASPMFVEDLPGRPGARRHGVLSSVSVPIADEKGSLGVINVGTRTFPARLTDAYVRALRTLGAQTALAMRNMDSVEGSWEMYLQNLQALATALEANDPYRRDASARTAALCVAMGQAIGLHPDEIVSLRIAAILHDVGMGLATGSLGASDRPLSTVDRGLVRSHPKIASDVMSSVPSLQRLAPVVRHHHEHFDGEGYDMGLAGDAIPLGSRILSVVDSFVAMTSPRPYRAALSVDDALEELSALSGTQFDPDVVERFRGLIAGEPELAFRV